MDVKAYQLKMKKPTQKRAAALTAGVAWEAETGFARCSGGAVGAAPLLKQKGRRKNGYKNYQEICSTTNCTNDGI